MSNQIRPLLSLIVPAYNEADRLPDSIQRIQKHSRSWNFPFEVIVVVEPSEDRTLVLAENAVKSWIDLRVLTHHEKRGKGFAVRSGMLRARGDLIFFTDADLSTPLEDLEAALALFAHDRSIDLIVGNRMHPESQILQRQSVSRERMGKVFNRIVQTLTGLRIRDTQCGFKGFRNRAAKEIFGRQRIDGFSFDVEVLLLARAMGFAIAELPVHWTNSEASRVHPVRDSTRMFFDVVRVRRLVKRTMHEFPYR
jgi:dolichyl-phosphate beta-glucosyltransferase